LTPAGRADEPCAHGLEARIQSPGAIYHLMNRGNQRERIFCRRPGSAAVTGDACGGLPEDGLAGACVLPDQQSLSPGGRDAPAQSGGRNEVVPGEPLIPEPGAHWDHEPARKRNTAFSRQQRRWGLALPHESGVPVMVSSRLPAAAHALHTAALQSLTVAPPSLWRPSESAVSNISAFTSRSPDVLRRR
jgi:hypothetical protein